MNITFVNYAGERTSLPGKVGDSLYEVARKYKYEFLDGASRCTRQHGKAMGEIVGGSVCLRLLLPPRPLCCAAGCGGGGSEQEKLHKEGQWYEPKYGEGASCYFCHVIIPKSHYSTLPPKRTDEVEQLQLYPFPEDMTDT